MCLSVLLLCEQEFAALLDGLQLEALGLVEGRLGTVPDAVSRHTSLRRLAIRNCSLTYLQPGPYLERLQHLDLTGNGFKTVPPAALAAPCLETLAMLGAC